MKNYNPPRYFTTHGFLHKVFDRRSKRQVCSCHNVADAEMIAEALNAAAAAPKEPSSSEQAPSLDQFISEQNNNRNEETNLL